MHDAAQARALVCRNSHRSLRFPCGSKARGAGSSGDSEVCFLGCKAAAHLAQLIKKSYQILLNLSNYFQQFFDAGILLAQP